MQIETDRIKRVFTRAGAACIIFFGMTSTALVLIFILGGVALEYSRELIEIYEKRKSKSA
jgi:uncharacterized membrane protein